MAENEPAPRWGVPVIVLCGLGLLVIGWLGRPLLLGVGFVMGAAFLALGLYWWRHH